MLQPLDYHVGVLDEERWHCWKPTVSEEHGVQYWLLSDFHYRAHPRAHETDYASGLVISRRNRRFFTEISGLGATLYDGRSRNAPASSADGYRPCVITLRN